MPTRIESPLALEQVESNRVLTCKSYDRCLLVAALAAWPSWSCMACPSAEGKLGPEVALGPEPEEPPAPGTIKMLLGIPLTEQVLGVLEAEDRGWNATEIADYLGVRFKRVESCLYELHKQSRIHKSAPGVFEAIR